MIKYQKYRTKLARINGVGVLIGAAIGVLVTFYLFQGQGGDAGIGIIVLVGPFTVVGALTGFSVSLIMLGNLKDKKRGLIYIGGMILLIVVLATLSNLAG